VKLAAPGGHRTLMLKLGLPDFLGATLEISNELIDSSYSILRDKRIFRPEKGPSSPEKIRERRKLFREKERKRA